MSKEQNIPKLNKSDPESLYKWVAYKISCPDFRNIIKDFINNNCSIFIDTEENFFEYEQIFKQFNKLIEDLIEDILHEGKISKEEFQKIVERGRKDIKYKKYFKQLSTFKDYNLFKSMMIKRNNELTTISENKMKEDNKRINMFILKASSNLINISGNPYALDSLFEEKTKIRVQTPKDVKITKKEKQTITNSKTEKEKDNKTKEQNNTPNSIISSLKEIVMKKIKINISNIDDEEPIMEEVDDEELGNNF